ncbi:MAG: hypothetical protein PW790_00320 [Parvibaculaceae bacterium]|nr:hypothetical protein [Parvibaculaceae bacterium]
MSHRLTPLLSPSSVAIMGASATPGSVGNTLARQILAGGFAGTSISSTRRAAR